MTKIAELASRRPLRADARRNYDALIAAARETFAELGTDAALEEIARRAGVGIATLYRNFPTRETLIESVYLEEVEAVCNAASEFDDLAPWDALVAWLGRLVTYVGTKRVLIEALNRDSPAIRACRDDLYAAGAPLLARAQSASIVRLDTNIDDVMRLVTGLSAVAFTDESQRTRVLAMALDGIRTRNL